jgi:hypothetical protein
VNVDRALVDLGCLPPQTRANSEDGIAVMMTSAEALNIRCRRNKAALANQEKRGAAPL